IPAALSFIIWFLIIGQRHDRHNSMCAAWSVRASFGFFQEKSPKMKTIAKLPVLKCPPKAASNEPPRGVTRARCIAREKLYAQRKYSEKNRTGPAPQGSHHIRRRDGGSDRETRASFCSWC